MVVAAVGLVVVVVGWANRSVARRPSTTVEYEAGTRRCSFPQLTIFASSSLVSTMVSSSGIMPAISSETKSSQAGVGSFAARSFVSRVAAMNATRAAIAMVQSEWHDGVRRPSETLRCGRARGAGRTRHQHYVATAAPL